MHRRENSYTHDEQDAGGDPHSVTQVLETLSRINHTYKLNAMKEWNTAIDRGTIHALVPIASGTEVNVDYTIEAEDVLRSPQDRCKLLWSL